MSGMRIVVPVVIANNVATSNCVFWQGAAGLAVSALQSAANTCYGKGLSVDGQWGPLTTTALKQIQSTVGTYPDGEYGPITRSAMRFSSTCSTNWIG